MMPLEKASAIGRASRLLAEQCRQELARLGQSCVEAEAYNEDARAFLSTARLTPPLSQSGECRPARLGQLPVVRGGDPGWSKRAEETRLFADKMRDASLKRELMAIAELYDKLAGAGSASHGSPSIGAMAA
jgi:hypothetical protein